jgi:hypothetical protein
MLSPPVNGEVVDASANEVVLMLRAAHGRAALVLLLQEQVSGIFVQAVEKLTTHDPLGAVPIVTLPTRSLPEIDGEVPHAVGPDATLGADPPFATWLEKASVPATVSFPVILEVPIVVVLKTAVDDVVAPIAVPLIFPPMISAEVTVVVPEK